MTFYFSGGSPIVETSLQCPAIMLSYYVNAKKGKPDARTKKILNIRRKLRKKANGNSKGRV